MRRYNRDGGYVYGIRHEHGFIKVGSSHDPMDRCKQLKTATPYNLYLYTTIEIIGDREQVEQHIHSVYDEHRVSGEWFELPDAVVDALGEIDELHQPVVENIDDWSLTRHIEFDESELKAYRHSVHDQEISEEVDDIVELVESGKLPRNNLTQDNAAIKSRAKKVNISPGRFLEHVVGEMEVCDD